MKEASKDSFCPNYSLTYTYYVKLIFKAFAKIYFHYMFYYSVVNSSSFLCLASFVFHNNL